MNTKKIVAFITLVMLVLQFGYSQNVKSQNCSKETQTNDTIISPKSVFYDIPPQYSESPKYSEGDEWAFYDCVWDNIDFTDIEVLRSIKIVILNCMIDTEGNIAAFKLVDPFTKKKKEENEYSPFDKEIIKGLAKTKKWIPAHLMGAPIAFPVIYRFRMPRGFWEDLESGVKRGK